MESFTDIGGWTPYSYRDYPETVSTVLFVNGCNLRCPYCQNPDIVFRRTEKVPPEKLFNFLEKRGDYVKGVVVTGGEPTMQPNLRPMIKKLKEFGLNVKLDTNALYPEVIESVLPWIDYLAFDVKTSPRLYHKVACTHDDVARRLRRTAILALAFGTHAEARMTVVRGFLDERVCHEVGMICRYVDKFYFQRLNHTAPMLKPDDVDVTPFTDEELENFAFIMRRYVRRCEIR